MQLDLTESLNQFQILLTHYSLYLNSQQIHLWELERFKSQYTIIIITSFAIQLSAAQQERKRKKQHTRTHMKTIDALYCE